MDNAISWTVSNYDRVMLIIFSEVVEGNLENVPTGRNIAFLLQDLSIALNKSISVNLMTRVMTPDLQIVPLCHRFLKDD